MSTKWRVYCTTHGYQFVWSDTEPIECPIDSNDTINSNRNVIILKENFWKEISISTKSITSSQYVRIHIFYHISNATLRRVSVSSFMQGSTIQSYDIQIYNKTQDQIILTKNLTNTGDYTVTDVGMVSQTPDFGDEVEFNAKINQNVPTGNSVNFNAFFLYIEGLDR